MTGAERGFLLLGSCLGDSERNPLSTVQLRTLAQRVENLPRESWDRELSLDDILSMGYSCQMGERILKLLSDEQQLDSYLRRGSRVGCIPLTRGTKEYPLRVRKALGRECPGCIWTKGNLSLLDTPMISLVGCRDLSPRNFEFAREVGIQAARQGYTLVSGNARGSDRTAQEAALNAGGCVISVIADELGRKNAAESILYLSEEDFDAPFSAQRALSRNRLIHSLGEKTLVAQSRLELGGTWSGTSQNLRRGYSPVFCFNDGSDAGEALAQMGASLISIEELSDFSALQPEQISFL